MRIEILEALNQKDSDDLFGWRERVFPVEGKEIEWRKPSRHIVARDDEGMAIGHVGFGKFPVISSGKEISVIGVGGVVVRPEHQSQRIPARLFEVLHGGASGFEEIKCFTLFCPHRLESYYEKHGYRNYDGLVEVVQREKLVTVDLSFMFRGNCDFGKSIVLTGEPW